MYRTSVDLARVEKVDGEFKLRIPKFQAGRYDLTYSFADARDMLNRRVKIIARCDKGN